MDTNKRTLGQARAEFKRIGSNRPSFGPSARRREFPDVLGENEKPLYRQNYKGGMVDENSPKISRGSAGRESAEKQRKKERILRELGAGPTISVKRIPNGKMIMPSTESMMREGEMDLVNYPRKSAKK